MSQKAVAAIPKKKKSLGFILKRYWRLYVMLIPPIVYLILFKYIPIAGLQIAFKKFNFAKGIWGSPWAGLYQFEKFFKSYMFERVLGNTVTLSLYSVIASFPLPIIFALMLNAMRSKRYRSFIENVTYMPHFISTVVMVGIINQIFDITVGVIPNTYKLLTGTAMKDLLVSKDAFPHLYVWSGVWQSLGWDTVIYTAALGAVAPELHEAALIDGATRFQRLIHVDFPAILPTVAITLILRCGKIMGIGFDKVYLMQNTRNQKVSEVISTYVYKQGLTSSGDYSYSTAVDMFNSVINFILIISVNFIAGKVGDTSLW